MTLVTPVIQSAGPSGSCRPFYTHHRDHERHSHRHHHGTQVPVLLLRAPTGRTALPVGAGDAKSEIEGFCDVTKANLGLATTNGSVTVGVDGVLPGASQRPYGSYER